jgi:hypothetical protein
MNVADPVSGLRTKKPPNICPTCGYATHHKINFQKHLRRVVPCTIDRPVVEEKVPVASTIKKTQKYPANDCHAKSLKCANPTGRVLQKDGYCILTVNGAKVYVCSICENDYRSYQGVQGHLETKHFQHFMEISNEHPPVQLVQTVTMINNGTINNNTIIVNQLGYDNIKHIKHSPEYDRYIQNSITKGVEGLGTLILKMHFDHERPENLNLRKLNKKDDFMEYHNGISWQFGLVENVLKHVFDLIYEVYDDFILNGRYPMYDALKKQRLDDFMKHVAVPLGWDLTGGEYDYDDSSLTDQQKEKAYDKIIKYCTEFVYRMSHK